MPWLEDGFQDGRGAGQARRVLTGFRGELYRCLTGRADALFELADAVLCQDRTVTDLARLSLVPEFRRGHGALYDGLNEGRADFARLRRAVAGLPLPAWPDGRIRLAADVSSWLRPDAAASPGRLFCHVKGGAGAPGSRSRGGRTRSWPRSGPGRRRGRCRWTRSGSAPAMTRRR
jgi:DDE superfamily endonuclease